MITCYSCRNCGEDGGGQDRGDSRRLSESVSTSSSGDNGEITLMVHETPAPRSDVSAAGAGAVSAAGAGAGAGAGVDVSGGGGDGIDGGDLGCGAPEQQKLPVVQEHSMYPSLCFVRPLVREIVEDGGLDDLKEVNKESRPTTRSGRVRLSPPGRRSRSARCSVLER